MALFSLAIGLLLAVVCLYRGWTRAAWVVPGTALLTLWYMRVEDSVAWWVVAVPFALAVLVLAIPAVRRRLITPRVLTVVRGILPRMSETERVALEAGTIWWDAELFSGAPDWNQLQDSVKIELSDEERAFLDGPVERVCAMTSDWQVEQNGDLSEEVWEYIREQRFFGMIIPKSYGGLEFSAQAHSAVVAKVSSRSTALAVTVMVPNSLGPAELLMHYGTDAQKDYYLPRLAVGDEIPCFALTEAGAGSDAGAISSHGVVCKGQYEEKEVTGIRLTWNKRYITLAPVATILGLAFQLSDPDGLLGDTEHLGITCALIPTDLPGVKTGDRHDPMGCAFMNGTTTGEDVFVPLDAIIGGAEMAGKGWMMLMQCLSVGRGISLPSLAAGATQLSSLAVGAYATVREQFGLPIGRFEGVQEALARIGGKTYAVEATRAVTAASVDAGEKPSVASAIAKCYGTEQMRQVVIDAMDIFGGAGISQGPMNILGNGYRSLPIGITVEGANILTRTMIIFGQGALRCHPFAQHEIRAAADNDVAEFDRCFFGHVGFVFQNATRALVHGLTGGMLASAPYGGWVAQYYQGVGRMSAAFAIAADVAMGTLGGALKFKERITGRLADTLAWMYIASACLEKFRADGRPDRDRAFLEWACQHALYEAQQGLVGFLDNLPARPVAWGLRRVLFPFGARYRPPSDELGTRVANALLGTSEACEALTQSVYRPDDAEPGLGLLRSTLAQVMKSREVTARIKDAIDVGKLEKKPKHDVVDRAVEAGVIDKDDRDLIVAAQEARDRAIQVDAFPSSRETAGSTR